jgi:hypothetical protein
MASLETPTVTWQRGDDRLWLRDISYYLPGARIFSYGYDSKVSFNMSAAGYDESARTLLEHIKEKSQRTGQT